MNANPPRPSADGYLLPRQAEHQGDGAGAIEGSGLAARMLLQVHDELLFEVPASELEDTRALVKREMEAVAHLDVPLVVDAGVGDSWADAH